MRPLPDLRYDDTIYNHGRYMSIYPLRLGWSLSHDVHFVCVNVFVRVYVYGAHCVLRPARDEIVK